MIPRVRTDGWVEGRHLKMQEPFVLDTRSHDIPQTIVGMIRALPENCVALSLRVLGGPAMVRRAESAARRRGIRILWVRQ
jgi:orotidine-5'-phosphate decarboxylase